MPPSAKISSEGANRIYDALRTLVEEEVGVATLLKS